MMTVPERPAAPFARVFGRVVLPDGSAVSSGRLVLDPDAKHPTVSLYSGNALVVSRTEVSLDSEGWVSSIVDGGVVRWVDVVAPGDSVTPGGAWTYTVTLSVPGREWWSRHVALTQGAVVDLADLAPQASYAGDALTIAESAVAAAAASAQDAATALERAEADIAAGLTKGDTGVGVVSILDEDRDGVATVTLTDGTTGSLRLPPGQQGDPGVGVASVTNPDGDAQALVTLTDGTTSSLPLPTVATPQFTAEASALAAGAAPTADVTGTYPDLTIALGVPEGAPGQDAVNPAFTASASTLAAGASATASVNGTYPNLTLALGIPRGAPGATGAPGAIGTASTYMLVGPGRPDVASTTGGVITGSEPVGAAFHSTDGASVGAWAWQKTTSGWGVTMGDTGWRVVGTSTTTPGGTLTLAVRRIGAQAYWRLETTGTIPTGVYYWLPRPSGFKAGPGAAFEGVRQIAVAISGAAPIVVGQAGIWEQERFGAQLTSQLQYATRTVCATLTPDPWPTTLPGTPA